MRIAILSLLLVAGCAGLNPPERAAFLGGDVDHQLCVRGTGDPAIAACQRVVARPDPVIMPMANGGHRMALAAIYDRRGTDALVLANHLLAAGRDPEAVRGALGTAVMLLQRAREHGEGLTPEARARIDTKLELAKAARRLPSAVPNPDRL